MNGAEAIGLVSLAYLLLLARSARRQGQMRQFLVALAMVLGLLAALAGIVWTVIALDL